MAIEVANVVAVLIDAGLVLAHPPEPDVAAHCALPVA